MNHLLELLMIIMEEQNWQNKNRMNEVKGLIKRYFLLLVVLTNISEVNFNYNYNAFIFKMVCFFVEILEKIL